MKRSPPSAPATRSLTSIVELENTDIIGLARATGMSMEELAQFLTQLKGAARRYHTQYQGGYELCA